MKKSLLLALSVLFILGLVIADYVAAQDIKVTLGGELRFRGWYLNNATGGRRAMSNPTDGNSQGWYDGRVRLSMKADVSPNTTGFVRLETATSTDTDADQPTSDGYTWGTLNAKPSADLRILEAWIQHKGSGLLGIPAGIKVGHMPLALGEKQFLDHTKFGDDAIVFFMDPTKELHIGLITAKITEGSAATSNANDTDAYVVLATYKVGDITIGANYTNVVVQAIDEFSFKNLGLHANGKAAGVSYKAEYNTQFGDASTTTEFDGYGLLLGAGYKVDPVNIRAEFATGSGDSDATDNKIKEFQTTMGNDVHYSFIYEYTTRTASRGAGAVVQGQVVDSRGRATGIANTTYYRLGADFSPIKDLTASIDGFIIRATKAIQSGQSKKVGTEVDVSLKYKIDKNLTYFITAGAFDPGDFWTTGSSPIVSTGKDKTITQAVHGVTLSF